MLDRIAEVEQHEPGWGDNGALTSWFIARENERPAHQGWITLVRDILPSDAYYVGAHIRVNIYKNKNKNTKMSAVSECEVYVEEKKSDETASEYKLVDTSNGSEVATLRLLKEDIPSEFEQDGRIVGSLRITYLHTRTMEEYNLSEKEIESKRNNDFPQ